MHNVVAEMNTVGVTARRLGRPIHRIEYLIRTRGIQPLGMAGNARIYSEAAVEVMAAELTKMESARAEATEPVRAGA